MAEQDQKQAQDIPEAEVLNFLLHTFLKENNEAILSFLQDSEANRTQDWARLQHMVSGARMVCVFLEVLSGANKGEGMDYSHLHVKLPDNYKQIIDKLELLQESCFVNLNAFQQFYEQNSKKLSS